MNFSDLDLDPKVLKAVEEAGYTQPTPIQEQAIPHALIGKDVLGIAQTGTGKTAAFTIPMISILTKGRARARMPRSLILCPTRELAAQVAENFEIYGKYHKLTMALLIGGVSFKDQDKLIDRGVDVLIATPGRLLDHFERGKLMLTGVQVMVVDEADRMLDMGFIPDIERIFGLTPFTRQTLFFSATMPPEITRLTETFLHNPIRVEVARQATAAETIEQTVVRHKPAGRERADGEKRDLLRKVIEGEGEALTNAIVFCNRKRDVDVVWKSLQKHGFNVGGLHGDLDQSVRTRTLDGFRAGDIRILIASDVAARGLDIPAVSHVINFDVPIHSEDYVHRIGRTGRAGRSGKAITLCFPHEVKHLDKIEELLEKKIPLRDSPLGGASEPVEAKGDAPEAASAEEKPKPRRRTRSRRKDEDAPAEAAAEATASETTSEAPAEAEAVKKSEKTKAEAAPEAAAETEKPARRTRTRSRRRTSSDAAPTETAPTETASTETVSTDTAEDPRDAAGDALADPRGEDPRDEAAENIVEETSGRESRSDNGSNRRGGRGRGRDDRGDRSNDRGGDRGNDRSNDRGGDRGAGRGRRGGQVVGMGDHVPAFMLREVDVNRIMRGNSHSEDPETAGADEAHEAA